MRNGRRTGIVSVYILSIPENAAGKQPAKGGPFIRNLPTFPSNNSCSGECDKTGPFRDGAPPSTPSFPTASDYEADPVSCSTGELPDDPVPAGWLPLPFSFGQPQIPAPTSRSEEHTSELQSRENLVCRLLLEKKKASTTH